MQTASRRSREAVRAAFIGGRASLPDAALEPLMILSGATAGAAWALLPAYLRTRFKVDDVVTTLLLNFVMFYGMTALLDGPWKDPLSGYPDSPDIRIEAEFPVLLRATRLHLGTSAAGEGAVRPDCRGSGRESQDPAGDGRLLD